MRRYVTIALACAMLLALVTLTLVAQQAAPAKKAAGGAPQQNQNAEPPIQIPAGFTPIFNGKDLTGWHISKTNHHGTTPDYHVLHGVIVATQNPIDKGGILLTDKKYKNVEVYMEVKPDYGCDSGLFLRSTEKGEAYQVMMDYLPGGNLGGVYGEELKGISFGPPNATPAQVQAYLAQQNAVWQKAWKREEWNRVRARIEGDVPHITTWINDQQIADFKDTANHAIGGAKDGMIAIQVHMGNRWRPAGFWRWRAIAVKELP